MLHNRPDYNERIQDKANIIPADEPVMLFRSQDELMPAVLRHYAVLLRKKGLTEMADQVNNHVELVVNWQENNCRKLPDNPKQLNLFNND